MKLKPALLLLACLGVVPLAAQQPLPPAEESRPAAPATPPAEPRGEREKASRTPEQEKVAYMGILTREVPAELRSQFSLPAGFGLMVDEIMPGSPAQAAGLKPHDVLLKFDDQRLVNMEQLMALVRARKAGETASLTLITGGKETQVSLTLGERQMPATDRRPQHRSEGHRPHGIPFFGGHENSRRGDHDGAGKDHREQMERFQKEMREYQERMQEWGKTMREYQERLQDWTRGNQGTPVPHPPGEKPRNEPPQRERSPAPAEQRPQGRPTSA